jgi:hypothetical protein
MLTKKVRKQIAHSVKRAIADATHQAIYGTGPIIRGKKKNKPQGIASILGK